MSRKLGSTFSTGLRCLSLQLESLFEECGGEHAVRFLDLLADVPAKRQRALLSVFSKIARECADMPSPDESSPEESMEEALYRDIMRELRSTHFAPQGRKVSMLKLMEGGKAKEGEHTGRESEPAAARPAGLVVS